MPEQFGEVKYHLAGWILFILCALLFILSALKSGDLILTLASMIFLAACVLFLIPILHRRKGRGIKERDRTGIEP